MVGGITGFMGGIYAPSGVNALSTIWMGLSSIFNNAMTTDTIFNEPSNTGKSDGNDLKE